MAPRCSRPASPRCATSIPVADLDVMIDVLRAIGAERRVDRPRAELHDRRVGAAHARGALRARHAHARVDQRARSAARALRRGARRDARRRQHRQPQARHAPPRPRGDGRRGRRSCTASSRPAPTGSAGARIVLEFPSVGATENLMTAAVLAKGETVIENAAREPGDHRPRRVPQPHGRAGDRRGHVDDRRSRASRSSSPADSEIMADRIEAGTLLMACGIAGGEIELVGARLEHLEMVVMKLCEMGMRVSPTPDGSWARRRGRLRAVDVATLPYPGFATDFMPIAVALLASRRRHRDRHRERVRQPVRVRRRARSAWAPTSATRAATRSCAGVAAAVGRTGARARRPGRRRARARGPGRRRRDRRATTGYHVDRGYSDLAAVAAHARRRRRARPRLALTRRALGRRCARIPPGPVEGHRSAIGRRAGAQGEAARGRHRHRRGRLRHARVAAHLRGLAVGPEDDWCRRVRRGGRRTRLTPVESAIAIR